MTPATSDLTPSPHDGSAHTADSRPPAAKENRSKGLWRCACGATGEQGVDGFYAHRYREHQ